MYDARDNIPVQLMRRLHLLSSIVIYSQLRLRFKRLVRVVEEVVIWHGDLSRDAGGGGKSSAEQDEPQRDSMGVNGGAKWGWDKGGGEVRETYYVDEGNVFSRAEWVKNMGVMRG